MNKQIEFNKDYTHYKNGLTYTPINSCKIQENDIWVEAIIYKTTTEELFVRSKKEFLSKFSKKI
jgi:hypothetical protein